jgi:pilus assembly protein CpaF
VIIEDTRELQLDHPNMTLLECQEYSYKVDDRTTTTVKITFDDALTLTLRLKPDRIILGEVRGKEASTLLDSFNTGHGGSIATIHASSAARALTRLAKLAMRDHQQAVRADLCEEVAACVNYVISAAMTKEGRKVTELIEVTGYDHGSGEFQYKTLFKYQPPSPTTQTTR